MAERELEGLEAEREPDELVAEADAEERHAAEQAAHRLDRPVELGRVARAVADEDGRRVELEDGVRIPGAGNDDGLERRPREPPHDRALAAEVERRRRAGRRRRVYGSRVHASSAGGGEASSGSASIRGQSRCGCASARACSSSGGAVAERAAQGAVRAQPPHERARVDLLERDDAPRARATRDHAGPGAPHHDSLRPDALGLERRLVDAVVADERIGEREHLARIARIGDRLLVARRSRS